jgi:hypothetical protein
MKKNHSISVLFFFLLAVSGQLFSQDLIFKKDNTILRVIINDFNGQTVTFHIEGDSTGLTHLISKSVIDSIRYNDGRSLIFTAGDYNSTQHLIKRNYIGVDIFNAAYSNLNIWYERISENGRRGFVMELLVNNKPKEYETWQGTDMLSNFNFNSFLFFTRVGMNFYPFNYSLGGTGTIRVFDGVSVLAGSVRKPDWSVYPTTYDDSFAACLMWNIGFRIYLGDHLQLKAGVEASVLPFLNSVCPEIGLSIGF